LIEIMDKNPKIRSGPATLQRASSLTFIKRIILAACFSEFGAPAR
jgi:hypothetical protein